MSSFHSTTLQAMRLQRDYFTLSFTPFLTLLRMSSFHSTTLQVLAEAASAHCALRAHVDSMLLRVCSLEEQV